MIFCYVLKVDTALQGLIKAALEGVSLPFVAASPNPTLSIKAASPVPPFQNTQNTNVTVLCVPFLQLFCFALNVAGGATITLVIFAFHTGSLE